MDSDRVYDIAVVGAGPAGLSAAINAVIRRKDTLVLSRTDISHRLKSAPRVDNYLGMNEVSGTDMNQAFLRHARAFNIDVSIESVTNIVPGGGTFGLLTDKAYYQSRSVILAVGIPVAADIKGESGLIGKGVSYCATCDGPLYRGKDVAVIGYTEQAEEEVEYLCEVAQSVHYLPQYRIDTDRRERLMAVSGGRLTILSGKPAAIEGEDNTTGLVYSPGGEEEQLVRADGVFILRAAVPLESLMPGLEMSDGAIKVARDLSTSVPGAFAAGDCTGVPWQIAKAVGEGQVAALSAVRYLSSLKDTGRS
jgi:thioredoxin reductase (NADPH)